MIATLLLAAQAYAEPTFFNRGMYFWNAGKVDEAYACFLRSEEPEARLHVGVCLSAYGRHAEAAAVYAELYLASGDALFLWNWCAALTDAGHDAQSLAREVLWQVAPWDREVIVEALGAIAETAQPHEAEAILQEIECRTRS